jgi:hypothetical protein
MVSRSCRSFVSRVSALLLAVSTTIAAGYSMAHQVTDSTVANPRAAARNAPTETLRGTVSEVVVVNARTGESSAQYTLRISPKAYLTLREYGRSTPRAGSAVVAIGKRNHGSLFVSSLEPDRSAKATVTSPRGDLVMVEGTLEYLYADDLDNGVCILTLVVVDADGNHTTLQLGEIPAMLERGMRVRATGHLQVGLHEIEPELIEILQQAPSNAKALGDTKAVRNSPVLTILIKYSDTVTEPYTQLQAQQVVFTNTNSVANYYKESSYNQHTLSGVVTPWFVAGFAKPATCDYSKVSTEARALAQAAGYNLASYEKFVYVFPSLPGCGWSGLGGGSQAWINQSLSLLVVGHELGHTFGLGHAGSLDCGALTIGGLCTRSEYGDPAEIMGNQSARQFNAPHKSRLGYLPTGTVKTHKTGTTSYTIEPLETAGASTFAVEVLASGRRSYWLEYRQPVGTFDASLGTGITGGAYIHLSGSNEYGCDTCVVDMTPATTTFGDASLPTGTQFVDQATGTTISVVARTAAALTVAVSNPARPSFVDVSAAHPQYAAIEALRWAMITQGCRQVPLSYCPGDSIRRWELAILLERAEHGNNFAYTAAGNIFTDMPASHGATGFVEQLYRDGITKGCAQAPLRYCPDSLVTRWESTIFLLRGRYGGAYSPGVATGTVFADVPASDPAAPWIERAYQYGLVTACATGPLRFCRDTLVTRGDVADFLQRTYSLANVPN